jgi:mono/diheme cytochrome c family protein
MFERSEPTTLLSRWCLLAGLIATLASCDFPGQPKPADRPTRADEVVDFSRLFKTSCAGCHGADGKLGPAPPLNDPLFLAIVPDDELLLVIEKGRPGTPMPAFSQARGGPLTEEQVKVLAGGMKTHWRERSGFGVEPKIEPPPYRGAVRNTTEVSAEAVERGKKTFGRACAMCHGDDGQGTTHTGAINDPVFLALISDQALRRIIITGRPDLGMPKFRSRAGRGKNFEPLSSAEIDELVALLASWRRSSDPAAPTTKTAAAQESTER